MSARALVRYKQTFVWRTRTLRSGTRLVDLHSQLEQIVESAMRFLCPVKTRLDSITERLDLVRQVSFQREVVFRRGAVRMSNEELHDAIHPRAHRGAELVDLVEVGKGAVERERAGVDELDDRRAEAVGVANVLVAAGACDKLEVGRGRYEGELA